MKEIEKITQGSLHDSQEIKDFTLKTLKQYPQFSLVPFVKDLSKIKKRLGFVVTDTGDNLYFSYECDSDHHAIVLDRTNEEVEYLTDFKKRRKTFQDPLKGKYEISCNHEEQLIYDYKGQLLVKYNKVSGYNYEKITDLILLDNGFYLLNESETNFDNKYSKYYIFSKENANEAMEITVNDYNKLVATYNIESNNMFLNSEAFNIKNPNLYDDIDNITLNSL